jgi:galactokinase
MRNQAVFERAAAAFRSVFGMAHSVAAYAPGRVEVLGNHTDYNEGFVLSAAIDLGTFFLAAPATDGLCRLVAGDLMEEAQFPAIAPTAGSTQTWSNYVKGVLAGLNALHRPSRGFLGLFLGNIPLGAGLSSSAALEMSTGMALSALYGIEVDRLSLARIGQAAEHSYAGVQCGLLDQITSLYGKAHHLVMTDFRSLDVEEIPMGDRACFLMCNTSVKHALVDGEYNRRHASCRRAAGHFAAAMPGPVRALRDVTGADLRRLGAGLDAASAARAAHVIGENERVVDGREALRRGDLATFGALMFASHESSRTNFENSCTELDFLVAEARRTPGVLGARLSGGGFGGSAVALVEPEAAGSASRRLAAAYVVRFGHPCDCRTLTPSDGAHRIAG